MDESLENLIQFYQLKYNISESKSIFDIFSEFFNYNLNAIDVWIENQFVRRVLKNQITSNSYRKQGNTFFSENNLKQSLQLYTKSLCFALPLSEEYMLALANRSAVTFERKNYEDSLRDINICLSSFTYPKNLKPKLLLRKADCLRELKRQDEFSLCLDEISELFRNVSLISQDRYIEKFNKLKEWKGHDKKTVSTAVYDSVSNLDFEENSDFAYASSKIELRYNKFKRRHVVAKENISKGDILFLEKAFIFSLIFDVETRDINTEICYHCLKQTVSGISCDSCVRCIFCDTTCKEQSWNEYHKYECMGMQTDMWYHLGITLPAFKAFCKGMNANSTGIQINNICFGSKFNNYPYFNSLVYHIDKINMSALVCSAILVRYLSKYTNFFQSYLAEPHCPEKDLHNLQKFVGSCITKHILQLENNSTVIENWIDGNFSLPTEKQSVACGIFPSVSLMNHSCKPNISNYFICDTIVVRAVNDIKKETEIFNCYGIHYRAMRRCERQKQLLDLYNFECKCVICSDQTQEMDVFNTLICKKCGYNIAEDLTQSFCYCDSCKSRIDLIQLREMNSKIQIILEGEVDEDLLLYCLNQRKQFLSETHVDLQDTYYKLYEFYARKGLLLKLITYFECWLKNEKLRIGENAQILGQLLYEIGLSLIRSLDNVKSYSKTQR
ncbi:hypothetical protein WA026_018917 [Henosepilachna vigintioctopunctata]